jgi:cell division protein FtsI (penicillin-binding protein 3)
MMRRIKAICPPFSVGARCRPGQGRLEGIRKEALDAGRTRLVFAGTLFLLAFMGIGARLVVLGTVDAGSARRFADRARPARPAPVHRRADIVDRNGAVLATSVVAYSVFADPARIVGVERTARGLKSVFPELDLDTLYRKLSEKRRFVWIRRRAAPAAYQRILRLGLAGVGVRKEERRVYPFGALTAHIVGFGNVDGRGLAGVEEYFDRRLRRRRDPLRLSVDVRAQAIVKAALQRAIKTFHAIGGNGLILDIKSGEILAMVSLPDFDPHLLSRATPKERFDRNTLGVYEMGSTFKIFNTAMALQYGVVKLSDRYDVRFPLKVGHFTIRDFHQEHQPLTVAQVFIKSSNIGSAKIAIKIGGARQKAFLKRLGLLKEERIELPERARPLYPRHWRPINTMTISFGHGIAVTPLHLVTAVAAIANDGVMIQPTLLRRSPDHRVLVRRVVSPQVSEAMLHLMRQVVVKGTGRHADVPGYLVGGKTGTAEKAGRHGYRHKKLLSSFVAVFPVDAPRFVVLVSLDEPKGTKATYGYATGGWVAAPVVRDVIARIGPMYGIQPRPKEPTTKPALMVAETIPAGTVYRSVRRGERDRR